MLRVEDELSFRAAFEEFKRETLPWQFAFGFDDPIDFADYVDQLLGHSRGIGIPAGWVQNTFFVGVVDGLVVGRLSLRHSLNDYLSKIGGHIGYGVIPSKRSKGYATELLRQAIPICASLGISKALVSCDVNNTASRKVIESCGGIFEGIVECHDSGMPKRRYWIPTATPENEN